MLLPRMRFELASCSIKVRVLPPRSDRYTTVKVKDKEGMSTHKENEPEERIESCSEKRQEITHTRYHLREDKRDSPDHSHDDSPDSPANQGVRMCMSRCAHHSEVDEFG